MDGPLEQTGAPLLRLMNRREVGRKLFSVSIDGSKFKGKLNLS